MSKRNINDWKCKICLKRFPMKTKDGNEDWPFCCDKPMTMQPMKKLVVKEANV